MKEESEIQISRVKMKDQATVDLACVTVLTLIDHAGTVYEIHTDVYYSLIANYPKSCEGRSSFGESSCEVGGPSDSDDCHMIL